MYMLLITSLLNSIFKNLPKGSYVLQGFAFIRDRINRYNLQEYTNY
jgi:hypothetical protein